MLRVISYNNEAIIYSQEGDLYGKKAGFASPIFSFPLRLITYNIY
jgi:hypothetical protein